MSDARLKSLIDRILRCREAEDEAKKDTKAVYLEAKNDGYEKAILGQVVAYLRKREKDGDKLDEQSTKFDLYLAAYDQPSHTHARERRSDAGLDIVHKHTGIAGQELPPHDKSTGELLGEPEQESQAKASEDNGATVLDSEVPADSVTGDVSRQRQRRRDSGERPAPNSADDGRPEGQAMTSLEPHEMDRHAVTAGETATNSSSSPVPPPTVTTKPDVVAAASGNLSDDEFVPLSFQVSKAGCRKLRNGHCKLSFDTSALCSECANKNAMEAA